MGQVRLACSTLAFNDRSLVMALEEIRKLGFTHADLAVFPGTFGHLDPETIAANLQESSDRVEAACKETGVEIVALNAAIGDAKDAAAQRLVMGLLLFAHRVGATAITLPAGNGSAEAIAMDFARWTEIGDRYGVKVTAEIHLNNITQTPAGCRALAERLPAIRFTLDPSHILIQGQTLQDWLDVIPRTAHVHIRDAGTNGWGEVQVPWGQGKLDLKDLLDRLDRIDYFGTLSVEYINPASMQQPPFDHIASIRAVKAQIEKLLGAG